MQPGKRKRAAAAAAAAAEDEDPNKVQPQSRRKKGSGPPTCQVHNCEVGHQCSYSPFLFFSIQLEWDNNFE